MYIFLHVVTLKIYNERLLFAHLFIYVLIMMKHFNYVCFHINMSQFMHLNLIFFLSIFLFTIQYLCNSIFISFVLLFFHLFIMVLNVLYL